MPFREIDGEKYWVPSMSPKGMWVLENRRRYTLLHGTRKAGKSNTAQHCVIQHCYNNDGANVAIVVQGLGMAASSGVWDDITGREGLLEKEWFQASKEFRWVKKPTMLSDSKLRYCELTNYKGGVSRIELHTLTRSSDVRKFKDSRFSMVYMVEVDRWDSSDVFFSLIPQLRVPMVPHERRSIILDCNPPKEGEDHWLHEVFIKDKKGNYPPDVNPDYMEVSFNLNTDNPFISEKEKQEIYDANKHDPIELDRNWFGKWVRSRAGSAFKDQYTKSVHVIGSQSNGTLLLPPPGSFLFGGGWDLGDAMNHAQVSICPVTLPSGIVVAYIIDELAKVGQNSSVRDFTEEIVEQRKWWTKVMAKRGSPTIRWEDYCDKSNLRYSAAADRSTAQTVLASSGEMEICLEGAPKGAGSVMARANMLRRLLFERRIFVSSKCEQVIKMLNELKEYKGKIPDDDPMKHIFDALTYPLPFLMPINQPKSEEPKESIISVS